MEISFSGERALVTGAAQGIGFGVLKKLVECGARVVALDKQGEKLEDIKKEFPGVETIVADLSDWDSTEKALKEIGRVQLVVNNAGVCCEIPGQEPQLNVVNRTLDVNLKGVIAVCKHVVDDWISAEVRGSIVNIASVAGIRPATFCPIYSASKAAVVQYTRCLALECAPKEIRVNAISPGAVNTELFRSAQDPAILEMINRIVPMPDKAMDPEDIANAVAFLLCDKVARRITGVNLNVDSGYLLT